MTFHGKILTLMAFRDIAHQLLEPTDGKSLRGRPFKEYMNFRFGPDKDRPVVRATGILEVWDTDDAEKAQLLMQSMQYGNYLKPFVGGGRDNDDTRVWDVFLSCRFSGNQITVPFFTIDSSDSKKKKRDPSLVTWLTEPSTTFERIIFLMFVIHLTEKLPPSEVLGKRKRCPTFTKVRINSQKLAFAVQRVIRAWDRLAQIFGFRDVEKMVIAYIVPSPSLSCYRVLGKRTDGYAPTDLERTFAERTNPTTMKKLISPQALQYTDDVDEGFRRLAKHFLSDLRMVAEDEDLYDKTTATWRYGDVFPKEGVIDRFQDISGEIQGLQIALGIQRKLGSDFTKQELNDRDAAEDSGVGEADQGLCGDHCECHAARSLVHSCMKQFIRMYNTSFSDILHVDAALKPPDAIDVNGKVQLVLTSPPPRIQDTANVDNPPHEVLLESDMAEVVNVINDLLRPGAHAIIFCSDEQFSKWTELFRNSHSEDEQEEPQPNFMVDEDAFMFSYKPGCNNSSAKCYDDEGVGRATLFKNVSRKAVHAQKLGCSKADAADMIRLQPFGHVHSRQHPSTNLIDMVPWLEAGEALYIVHDDGERKRVVLVDEICTPLLRELICRFSYGGDIVADLFMGSSSCTVASITIPKEEMRVFVGSEIDEAVFNAAMRRVQEEFASILADQSQRSSAFPEQEFSPETIEAAQLLVSHKQTRKRPRNICGPPPSLPVLSILPKYIMQYVLLRERRMHRFNSVNGKPFHEWPVHLQGIMQSIDFEELLAVECAHTGLYVASSSIKHEKAGLGVFTNRSFAKNEVITTYYGRIVYEDLSNWKDKESIYGDGFPACSAKDFLIYGMSLKVSRKCHFHELLPPELLKSEDPYREVYVIPFPFSVAARINDPRYVEGDSGRFSDRNRRQCNVTVVQKQHWEAVKKPSHLQETDALKLVATRDIRKNEEFFFDYGDCHMLNEITAYSWFNK